MENTNANDYQLQFARCVAEMGRQSEQLAIGIARLGRQNFAHFLMIHGLHLYCVQ
jgi:hypothetical protein